MKKVLVPCDGSENALRAVRYAVAEARSMTTPVQIELVHVLEPVMAVKHADERSLAQTFSGEHLPSTVPPVVKKVLQTAIDILDQAGVKYEVHCP